MPASAGGKLIRGLLAEKHWTYDERFPTYNKPYPAEETLGR